PLLTASEVLRIAERVPHDDSARRRGRRRRGAGRPEARSGSGPARVLADTRQEPAEAAERRIGSEVERTQEARRRAETRPRRAEGRNRKPRRRPRAARVRADAGKETTEAAERRVRAEIERPEEARRRGQTRGARRTDARAAERRRAEAEYRKVDVDAHDDEIAIRRSADGDAGLSPAERFRRRRLRLRGRAPRDAADLRAGAARQDRECAREDQSGRISSAQLHVTSSTPQASVTLRGPFVARPRVGMLVPLVTIGASTHALGIEAKTAISHSLKARRSNSAIRETEALAQPGRPP